MARLFSLTLLLIISVIPYQSFATVWNVGPSYDYTTPNAFYLADAVGDIDIADFDTIYIEIADYSGTDALAAWQQNNLYISGENEVGGRPHMIADGAYILGKGTWVCVGDNITVSNIEFSGAAVPDENGAGIRLDGIGLTLLKCYFHHNENGLLTSNPYDGDIFIQFCEFGYNGFGDGFTHNMYIGHVNNFTLSHCYSHHTNVGHNVKSRANNTYILYNRIMDEEDGNSSRLIDIPNGGYALVKGNDLMQGPEALNNNAVGYGLEGLSNPAPHEFYFVHNSIVNKREASCRFLQIADGTEEAYIVNNIFGGIGELVDGETTTFSHNYAAEDVTIFEFEGEEVYSYQIGPSSVARDSGMVLTGDLEAISQYFHEYYEVGPREMHGTRPDVGSHEYHDPIGFPEFEQENFVIYPNPSNGSFQIQLNQNISSPFLVQIFDLSGQLLYTNNITADNQMINMDNCAKNCVIVKVTTQNYTYNEKLFLN
ncbi:MAG: T9SS type A sorting domain-containing protein [Crocinitomix sp.]|nr:T9SS type A sorting domain-containing protein [Crocinitomix sp.]